MIPLSRRAFVGASAAAVTAVFTAGKRVSANDRIGFAVIGCRNRGHQDAASFITTGQFALRTLCDCDTTMLDRARSELGEEVAGACAVESDFRRVLDDPDVDAVVISTPDHWHAAMTVMALDAGKHVYVEKPASYNIGDGKLMMRAAQAHPKLMVQVGTQQRSGRHFMDAKRFIDEGGLGDVAFARAWIAHTRERIDAIPDTPPPAHLDYEMWVGPAPMHLYNEHLTHYNWHWVRDWGTGEMGNWGAHWLDVARWLVGLDLPRAVTGHGGQFVTQDVKQWPDTQTVLYDYPDVTLVWEQRLWTDYSINGMRNGVEIGGEKGTLLIDRGGWTFHPRDGEREQHGSSDLERAHAQNFADAIRGDAAPTAPMVEGHKSAVLCHLGNIATVLNRRVAFDGATETIVGDEEAAAWEWREYRAPWDEVV